MKTAILKAPGSRDWRVVGRYKSNYLNFIGYLYMIDQSQFHSVNGDVMEFGKLVGNSFEYAKEGLVGHWLKWIVLIILSLLPAIPIVLGIIFGVVAVLTAPAMLIPVIAIMVILTIIFALPLLGYIVQVYRGETPAPEVKNWGKLLSDGFKLLSSTSFMQSLCLFLLLPSLEASSWR